MFSCHACTMFMNPISSLRSEFGQLEVYSVDYCIALGHWSHDTSKIENCALDTSWLICRTKCLVDGYLCKVFMLCKVDMSVVKVVAIISSQ